MVAENDGRCCCCAVTLLGCDDLAVGGRDPRAYGLFNMGAAALAFIGCAGNFLLAAAELDGEAERKESLINCCDKFLLGVLCFFATDEGEGSVADRRREATNSH